MQNELKVMSFNLRYRNENDGANCFDFRYNKILSVIQTECPDVIGFQEVTDEMMDRLEASLADYVLVGHGRGKDLTGRGLPLPIVVTASVCMHSIWSGFRMSPEHREVA